MYWFSLFHVYSWLRKELEGDGSKNSFPHRQINKYIGLLEEIHGVTRVTQKRIEKISKDGRGWNGHKDKINISRALLVCILYIYISERCTHTYMYICMTKEKRYIHIYMGLGRSISHSAVIINYGSYTFLYIPEYTVGGKFIETRKSYKLIGISMIMSKKT